VVGFFVMDRTMQESNSKDTRTVIPKSTIPVQRSTIQSMKLLPSGPFE